MSGYDKKDAARDTDTSTSKVAHAWHDAKDAAEKESGWRVPADRHARKENSEKTGSKNSGK